MALEMKDRPARVPRQEVEVPFEASRTGLEVISELATQMCDALNSLPPELRSRAQNLLAGFLPVEALTDSEKQVTKD
jgi:hypothetical protein